MSYTLLVGNKNYSSWSMRPWVLMTQAGIPFTEQMVRLDSFAPGSSFKQALTGISPTGKVPALIDDSQHTSNGQPLAVWDTPGHSRVPGRAPPRQSPVAQRHGRPCTGTQRMR